jgi:hypothetical protein
LVTPASSAWNKAALGRWALNAVYHATGKRIRRFPITLDKLLD